MKDGPLKQVIVPICDTMFFELAVSGITCADCSAMIESKLTKMPGIFSVSVSVMTGIVQIYSDIALFPTAEVIEKVVVSLGFGCKVLQAKIRSPENSADTPEQKHVTLCLEIPLTAGTKLTEIIAQLEGVAGVVSVRTEQRPAATFILVSYSPHVTGGRDLFTIVESSCMGVVPHSRLPSSGASSPGDLWRFRLFFSLVFALPIFLLVFVFASWPSLNRGLETPIVNGFTAVTLVLWILATPVQVFVGYPLYISAYRAGWYGRTLNIDSLIVLSTTCAYVYSTVIAFASMADENYAGETFFDTCAMVLLLISLGRYMESVAKGKAADSLAKLAELQVETATLYRDPHNVDVHTALVQRNDILVVTPGTRIPTDGIVTRGQSTVDESHITGEAKPVHVAVGSKIVGGSVNIDGLLHIQVERVPGENLLSGILQLVQQAQSSKPDVQRLADKVAAYFVPVIVAISLTIFIIWYALAATGVMATGSLSSLAFALRFALATLVVSCPCAIGLAVPTAIIVASGVGARLGCLFKSGPALELCHKVDTVIFDKTGTLTKGHASVVDWRVTHPSMTSSRFWSIVGSAEDGAQHAIARGLVDYARAQNARISPVDSLTFLPGRGLECMVDSVSVLLGNLSCMKEHGVLIGEYSSTNALALQKNVMETSMKSKGWDDVLADMHACTGKYSCTELMVAVNGKLVGWIAMSDSAKHDAADVVRKLTSMGIAVWILSGDSQAVTEDIALTVGVPVHQAKGALLPADKADVIAKLQAQGHIVAMVGDGINDSPALATANVGIAVANGTDVAVGTANVALMKDDLYLVVTAIELSKATYNRIMINFGWAAVYNTIAVPFAAGLLYPALHASIPPAFAGLSELLSSLPVILFSVMLRNFRPSLQHGQPLEPNADFESDETDIDTEDEESMPLVSQ